MTVKTEWMEVKRDGLNMGVFVARPSHDAALGIVMLQEIFGVNEAMKHKAEQFAEAGFAVALPDLFWRLQPRVDLGYGEDDRKAGFGFMQRFDFAAGIADVVVTADWLIEQSWGGGKVAFVGFCLGGKLAVMAGARRPSSAVASFYGVKLEQNLADLDRISCPLQIHVGDKDVHVPMETVRLLQSHLTGRAAANVYAYPRAQHGFFNERRADVFDADATSTAFQRTIAMLKAASA